MVACSRPYCASAGRDARRCPSGIAATHSPRASADPRCRRPTPARGQAVSRPGSASRERATRRCRPLHRARCAILGTVSRQPPVGQRQPRRTNLGPVTCEVSQASRLGALRVDRAARPDPWLAGAQHRTFGSYSCRNGRRLGPQLGPFDRCGDRHLRLRARGRSAGHGQDRLETAAATANASSCASSTERLQALRTRCFGPEYNSAHAGPPSSRRRDRNQS